LSSRNIWADYLTNPVKTYRLYLETGVQFPLVLTSTVPSYLAEGTYQDRIYLRLVSRDEWGNEEIVKESWIDIVATQTAEGLRLHTAFDAGNLRYVQRRYFAPAFFSVKCPCRDGGGYLISGNSGGVWFTWLGPYGFGGSGLSVPAPVIGYGHQQVKLEISQDVMLEREAFLATLVMTNGITQSLQNMSLSIVISNSQGISVTSHFAIALSSQTVLISSLKEPHQPLTLVPASNY
jgi:hypothetical protein